jgi:hypothetical protein
MATRYKVVVQDENGVELGSKFLTQVETKIVKHAVPGDAGFLQALNKFVQQLIDRSDAALFTESSAQCDALGLIPTDFSNGVKYAIQEKWVTHVDYQDAETRGLQP